MRLEAIVLGTEVDFIETLKFVEVQALHQLDGLDRGGHERLDGVVVLELAQVLGQRAGVDPHAQRRAALLGERDHLGDLLRAADVAGVQAHAVRARLDRLQRERVVEVDVGDHRDRRLRDDRLQRLGVLLARHRHAHDVRAGVGDRADLVHRRREVGGLGLGHRLHGDGRAAADRDRATDAASHVPLYGRSGARMKAVWRAASPNSRSVTAPDSELLRDARTGREGSGLRTARGPLARLASPLAARARAGATRGSSR